MESIEESRRVRAPLRLLGLAWMGLALALLTTFWQSPYLLNLVSPFRAHLVLGQLLLALPLALWFPHPNRWVFLAFPLVVSMTLVSYVLPRAATVDPAHSGSARVALANIHSSNRDLSRLSAWVSQEKPDVLVLLEVTEAHRSQIEALPFAYRSIHARQSNFGLALLSQRPPTKLEVLEEETPFPSILASWPEYRVLATHPIPPISKEAREVGDQQVLRLIDTLANPKVPPVMVVGDLNATGWDRRLECLKSSGFREARMGHGFLPTWPADRPVLGIPIDHVFIPENWDSRDCRRGPDIGSDHYPLVADVAWSVP